MSYDFLIHRFVHPFIIYVFIGTLVTYFLSYLIVRIPGLNDSRSRALIYILPFLVPLFAFMYYRPFIIDKCEVYGHPLGIINDWLCFGGEILATILTPVFVLITIFAFSKGFLSVLATGRIVRTNGYASPEQYPQLFELLEKLCAKANLKLPLVVVTGDSFARSFTMGYWSPVIVISEGLIISLEEDELETVLAHELGHIIRADSLLNWVTVFSRDIMFFTPIIYWIFKDLIVEREKAADDIAIKLTDKPMAFAQALIKVWRLSPRTAFNSLALDNFMPHPHFVYGSGTLEYRVKRILEDEHSITQRNVIVYPVFLAIAVFSIWVLYWVC